MTHIWKRSISMLLALVMVFGMLPTAVFAEEEGFEEQPFVEEPAAEGTFDEEPSAEESEEESEGEPEEEEPSEEESTSVFDRAKQYIPNVDAMTITTYGLRAAPMDGYVWLDGTMSEDEIRNYILANGLSGMICEALGMGDSWDVYFLFEYTFMGVTGNLEVSMGAPDVWNMSDPEAAAWMYLAENLRTNGNFQFILKQEGEEPVGRNVGFRSINKVKIEITADDEIAAESFAAASEQIAAAKTDYSVDVIYDGSENIPLVTDWNVTVVDIDVADITEADWPDDGTSETVAPFITATIEASMEGTDPKKEQTALILKDTTPVYTVQYDLNYGENEPVAGEALAAGKDTPTYKSITGAEAPTRKYYTFNAWNPVVAEKIVAPAEGTVITYKAQWTPINNVNGNEFADEEEEFKIVYQDEIGDKGGLAFEEPIVLKQYAWQKTPVPADPADYTDDNGTVWKFVEWYSEDASDIVQATANADKVSAVYTAQWTADHLVNFLMHDNSKRVTVVPNGGVVAVQQFSYKYQSTAGTWYYADAEGNYIDVGDQTAPVEYDFYNTPVTGDLYLVADWFEDRNENNKEDGTSDDPIYRHTWYKIDGTVADEKTWVVGDKVTDEDDLVCTYKEEGYYFNGWLDEPAVNLEEDGRMYIQYTHRPNNPVKDVNGNQIDDNLETIKLDIPVASTGKGTVTVSATNLVDKGNGTYIYDSRTGYEFCRNITITATPVVSGNVSESYVAEIKVNGEIKTPTYQNFVATCSYTVGSPVAAAADEESVAGETIEVIFEDAKLTLKDDNVMQFIVGQTVAEEDKIYNAAVEAPAYDAAAVESLKYLARAAGTKEVSVAGIQEQIDNFELPSVAASMVTPEKFAELKQKATDKLNELTENGMYTIQLDAVWLDVDAEIEEVSMEKVVDDAAKKVMNSVMNSVLENIDYASSHMSEVMEDALAEFERTINVQATMADCHLFGRNTSADADKVTEQLEIIYKNDKMRVVAKNVPIQLQDKRIGTEIKATDVEIYYGTEFDPLKHAKLTTKGGTAVDGLELDGEYADLIPGTYTVYLKFDGNNEFKPSKGSYKLKIVGPTITVSVKEEVISDNINEIKAEAKPIIKNEKGEDVDFDSITGLHVVAGYDVTQADSLNFENNSLKFKAYAKVKMSAKLETMLTAAGINKDQIAGTYTLQEFLNVLNNDLKMQLPADIKSSLESVLNTLKMDNEDVSVQVDICDAATDPYPENPGAYLNLVYAVEDGIVTVSGKNPVNGMIVYHPAFYIPDNGINLTYGTQTGPKLAIPSEAANKTLKVMRGETELPASEYSIYYVGVTGDGESYMDSKAPTKDGLYFVGAVDLRSEQNRISTDCALVTIGLEQGKLVIDNLTKVEEKPDANYLPNIQVNEGAAITMISGTIGVEVDELKQLTDDMTQENIEKLIGAFYGNVHIEIPAALHSKLKAAWKTVAENDVVSEHIEKMPATMPEKANPAHVLKVLKYLKDANNKVVNETLGRIQKIDSYVNEVMDYVNATYDKLYYAVDLLNDKVTVSMNSTRQTYSAAGIYAYVGVVTDPAFVPDMDAGVLVIENGATFQLGENKFIYDGNEHAPELIDEIKQGNMMIIRQGDEFNFLLDGDLEKAIVKKIEEVFNKTFTDGQPKRVTVDELYAIGEKASEKLAEIVVAELAERAKALLNDKFQGKGMNALNSALSTLENRLIPAAQDYLINALKDLDGVPGNADAAIVINGDLPVNVGEYPVYAISYGIAMEEGILEIKPIEIDTVELDQYEFIYDGAQKTVKVVTVKAGDLVVPADAYTITGKLSGTDVNTYIVTVKDNGTNKNFIGEVVAEWTIETADVADLEVTLDKTTTVYNAEDQSVKVISVKDGDKTLVEGTDYTVSGELTGQDAGTYTVTVEFMGNYSGTKEVQWKITKAVIDSATLANYEYDGKAKSPAALEVKAGSLKVPTTAYVVAGDAGTNVGQYEATVSAWANSNFTGSVDVTWEITAKSIDSGVEATLSAEELPYNGEPQNVTLTVKDGDKTLVEGTDYIVSGPLTGENAGTYNVTIEFIGNYSGTEELSWTITPAKIDSVVATNFTYDGELKIAEVTEVKAGELVVPEGAYTVSYSSAIAAGTYSVTVSAADPNYTGTVTVDWKINPAELTSANVQLDGTLVYNEKIQTQKVKVLFNDAELAPNHYTVTGNVASDAGEYTMKITFNGNYTGEVDLVWSIAKATIDSATATDYVYDGTEKTAVVTEVKAGTLVVPADAYTVTEVKKTDAGDYTVTVTANEQSNFTGSMDVEWRITAKEITVTLEDINAAKGDAIPVIAPVVKDAEGNEITDANITITITDAEGNPVELEDAVQQKGVYTITVSVGNTNYVVSDASDLEAILTVKSYVAKVGETKYETLQEAVDAVELGGMVQLLDDAGLALVQKPVTIVRNGFSATVAALSGYTVETSDECYIVKPISEIENPTGAALAYVDLNDNGTFDGEEELQSVNDALQTADIDYQGAHAVRLTKNIEGEDAEVSVLIPGGVTLDIQSYTLETRYLTGLTGSTLGGTRDNASGAGGTLKIPAENLALPFDVIPFIDVVSNVEYAILPIYDANYDNGTGRYTFGRFIVAEPTKVEPFVITDDHMHFEFAINTTQFAKDAYVGDGMTDNKLAATVRLEWTLPGKGTAYQDFVYDDHFVESILNNTNMWFTFDLDNYKELGITDLTTLKVCGLIKGGSGIELVGNTFPQKN